MSGRAAHTALPRDMPALSLFANLDEAAVHAILTHQFRVSAALGYAAVVNNQYLIGVLYRREAVRNRDYHRYGQHHGQSPPEAR